MTVYLALIALFTGSKFASAQVQAPTPDEIPVIRVTGDHNYPPYCYLDNGIPSGFDIDVIRAIAEAMNLKIVIQLQPWSDARRDLEEGRADVIPGMARIPAREAQFEFTTATKHLQFDLFVREDSRIRNLADAREAKLVVQKSGVMYDIIKQEGKLLNITPVTDAPEAIRLLAAGEYEGAIVNKAQGYYILDARKFHHIRPLNIDFPTLPYCLATRKGETELIGLLNEGLNVIRADKTYDRIYDQWFGFHGDDRLARALSFILAGSAIIVAIFIVLAAISWSLRKQVQRKTAEQRQIIDLIPHMIFARDKSGRYILANQAMADSMGLDVAEIVGSRHRDLFPNDPNATAYLEEDQVVLSSRQHLFVPEVIYLDRHGRRHCIQVTKIPFRFKDGAPTSVLCTAVDVTPVKEAEEEAKRSREDLMTILNSIADGVFAINQEQKVTLLNPIAERMTGWTSRESRQQPLSAVLKLSTPEGDPMSIDDLLHRALGSPDEAGLAYNVIVHALGGQQLDVSLNWSPIHYTGTGMAGFVLVLRDVTVEQQMNKRLYETQKLESIGRLAGGVAHDFNNLLTGIIGYSELLNAAIHDDGDARGYLKGIFESSERARDLVQQLLTFSRRQPMENRPVDMNVVIGHVTALLHHTLDRRIVIARHLNAFAHVVNGDRSQLQNAMLNLGVNARDAMPNGGSLTITTRNIVLTESDCNRFPYPIKPGEFIEIAVTDTGIGMDRETMTHIFEPFFTTKGQSGGTGLGLAAVYGTIKDHGGYIDVSSRPGHGSEFTIGLPALEAAEAASEPYVDLSEFKGAGTILVVDDESHVLKTMTMLLHSLGYNTLTATNGREALDLYKSQGNRIDLILLDMIMPELTGEQTYRELRRINPDVRVIISSGYLQEHKMSDLMDIGILAVLQKPFRKNDLAKKIAYCMRFGAES